MKLRAIAVLKERGVALFGTTNDKDNVPMLTVNRKLGYVPEPPSIRMKKTLTLRRARSPPSPSTAPRQPSH